MKNKPLNQRIKLLIENDKSFDKQQAQIAREEYLNASEEQKALVDNIFVAVCGESFANILKNL